VLSSGFAPRTGKVYVTPYTDWGRPNEKVTRRTVTLKKTGERQRIAVVRR
jgi:hypothetical protein